MFPLTPPRPRTATQQLPVVHGTWYSESGLVSIFLLSRVKGGKVGSERGGGWIRRRRRLDSKEGGFRILFHFKYFLYQSKCFLHNTR
jgi:hypothetical protein